MVDLKSDTNRFHIKQKLRHAAHLQRVSKHRMHIKNAIMRKLSRKYDILWE